MRLSTAPGGDLWGRRIRGGRVAGVLRPVGRTLYRASLRHLARHPWQTGLSILGIALGVAVVVSIDLANASARRAFVLSAEGVTGRATHQIVGGPGGLDERIYVRLRVDAGVHPAAPVVEGYVAAADFPGRTLHLLGIDPLTEGPFRPYLQRGGGSLSDLSALLTQPASGLLSGDTAQALGLAPGATMTVRISGARHTVRLVGLILPHDSTSRLALESLLVTDIATAQELLGLAGRLSRIDLIVPDGSPGERLLARIRAVLPPAAEVIRASARSEFVEQLTRAFSVNLTALSLLALIVGMFLIYNTMTFSVVQRRASIGMLRALGVTRREIFTLLLAEVALVGSIATVAGLLLGIVLGRGLLRLVTQTINDLYFVLGVHELAVAPLVLLKGAALGLGATLVAAVVPALEATTASPGVVLTRATIEARLRRAVPRSVLAGVLVLVFGSGLLLVPSASLVLSYGGLFALVLGAALLTPGAAVVLVRVLQPGMGWLFGALGRMAARGVVASLSRTAVAIAALMVSIAATVGVGLMVGSFRQTVVRWLETSLVADVYVSSPSFVGSRADSTLDPAVVTRLVSAPGVLGVGTYRSVRVQSPLGPTRLVALHIEPRSYGRFRFLEGAPDVIWPAFQAGGAAIVSEPYAYRHRLRLGSRLQLRTDRGEWEFPVVGVFSDYGSDQGVVMLSRRTYETFWDDRGISSLGLSATPGTDVGALAGELARLAGPDQELVIRPNRVLRESSLAIFDRTFAITGVLRLLATVVAFIGVLSALMALQIERARELGVLRALGLTPRQVWGVVTSQTGLMGLIAGLVAIPVGIAVALVLIFVINRRSFGWTLEVAISPSLLLQAVGLALIAAILAGVYPALRMARTSPAQALREE